MKDHTPLIIPIDLDTDKALSKHNTKALSDHLVSPSKINLYVKPFNAATAA
jgi:hypothetical protein